MAVLSWSSCIKEIIKKAQAVGAKVMIDGAQAAAHISLNMQSLGADFYCFSAHKLYGPTGVGILYGKEDVLNELPPYQGGGEMIKEVSFSGTTYAELPHKFEAGTPPLVEAYGLGVAIDYVDNIGMEKIEQYEKMLTIYADKKMSELDFVNIYSKSKNKTSIISFNLEKIHAHEVASFLDVQGIAVRAGHHCCQPLMKILNVVATSRLSFGIYNNKQEIDYFIDALIKCNNFFSAK